MFAYSTRYINNLLRYSVEELGKISKLWIQELQKQLGKNIEVEIHFAKAALETDVDKVLLTTWLVDVGMIFRNA